MIAKPPTIVSTIATAMLVPVFALLFTAQAASMDDGTATVDAEADAVERKQDEDKIKLARSQRRSVLAAEDRKELAPRRMPPRRKGEISFDTLLFDMEKNEAYDPKLLTGEIKALEGKTVKIRGFILPASVFQQVGIKQFVLVRDNQECCFGPGAALYDCIMVKMTGDNTAKFSTRPVAVKGKFHVTDKYKFPDGTYMAIYEMEATEVE